MKINLLTVTWLATCCDLVLSFRQHHFQNPSSSDAEFQLKSIVQFGYHKHPSKSLKLTGKSTNSILSILDLEDSSEEEYTAQNLEKFHIDEDVIWSEDSAFSAFSNELRIPRKDPSKDLGYRRAVLNLAKMAGHAYKPQPKKPWKDLDPGWNVNASFGWDDDRIRGYVFGNTENTKLIVAIKGTTFNFLGFSKSFMGGMLSPIGRNDRKMDNIMFSCCCGAISGNWRPVCSCGRGTNLCKQSCLEEHAVGETTYYHGAMLIYDALIQRYPKSKISFTGHSLGGALASLMGLTTNLPAFTFEAPGDLLYAQRAKLTQDYKAKNLVPPILHFGNNADPIYTGTCNGKMSLCYLGGYGMDSKCHTGLKCTFDTKEGKDWSPSLIHHRLPNVINNILEDWAEGSDDTKLNCSFEEDCQDCEAWKFI